MPPSQAGPAAAPAAPSDLLEHQRVQLLNTLVAELQDAVPDPTCANEFKRFKKCVDQHPSLSPTNDNPPKHVTRANVDMCFMEVVSK